MICTITTSEAGFELIEQIAAANAAGPDLPGKLAVELARDTQRNFFASMVIGSYRAARSLSLGANGQGGFISKEYWSGIYKAAGAATAAYCLRWEVLDFIVSNLDLLKLYTALAFEQYPSLKTMIDWLELHIKR